MKKYFLFSLLALLLFLSLNFNNLVYKASQNLAQAYQLELKTSEITSVGLTQLHVQTLALSMQGHDFVIDDLSIDYDLAILVAALFDTQEASSSELKKKIEPYIEKVFIGLLSLDLDPSNLIPASQHNSDNNHAPEQFNKLISTLAQAPTFQLAKVAINIKNTDVFLQASDLHFDNKLMGQFDLSHQGKPLASLSIATSALLEKQARNKNSVASAVHVDSNFIIAVPQLMPFFHAHAHFLSNTFQVDLTTLPIKLEQGTLNLAINGQVREIEGFIKRGFDFDVLEFSTTSKLKLTSLKGHIARKHSHHSSHVLPLDLVLSVKGDFEAQVNKSKTGINAQVLLNEDLNIDLNSSEVEKAQFLDSILQNTDDPSKKNKDLAKEHSLLSILKESWPSELSIKKNTLIKFNHSLQQIQAQLDLKVNSEQVELSVALPEFSSDYAFSNVQSDWSLKGNLLKPLNYTFKEQSQAASIQQLKFYLTGTVLKGLEAGESYNLHVKPPSHILIQEFAFDEAELDELVIELDKPAVLSFSTEKSKGLTINEAILWHSKLKGGRYKSYNFASLGSKHGFKFKGESYHLNSQWQLDDLLSFGTEMVYLGKQNQVKTDNINDVDEHILMNISLLDIDLTQSLKTINSFRQDDIDLSELSYDELDLSLSLLYELGQGMAPNKIREDQDPINVTMDLNLSNLSGKYQDMAFSGFNISLLCKGSQFDQHCDNKLSLDKLFVGLDIDKLALNSEFNWQDEQLQLKLGKVSGEILAGHFSSHDILIEPQRPIKGNIVLSKLSLAELSTLLDQPGVSIDGLVDGVLPFVFEQGRMQIMDGSLTNHEQGLIKIDGNPTIEGLKQSQPSLKDALDALKELKYSRLLTNVSMLPDGETQVKVAIEGRSKGIERPINFNYQHQENLLQLLQSLRVDSVVSEALTEKYNKP